MTTAHGFVDGGYLKKVAETISLGQYADPRQLVNDLTKARRVSDLRAAGAPHVFLKRVTYYDGMPVNGKADDTREAYWKAVELLNDTHLGFGDVRGEGIRRSRQKGVDTLIAVDMLVGAFTRLYDLAVLIAGDADFVPVVREVRRRGASVVVAAEESSLADDLRRAADRVVRIVPAGDEEGTEQAIASGDLVTLCIMSGEPFPLC